MMTHDKIKEIIAGGEGQQVEFKRALEGMPNSVYETICAFLNRRGGHILLGVEDSGKVTGIKPENLQKFLDKLAKDTNNQQLFRPPVFLNFEPIEIEGKQLIYFYVPQAQHGHSYKGAFYDRNQDGDFELRSPEQIAAMFIRKSNRKTEDRVIPGLTIEDLDQDTFDRVRNYATLHASDHAWANLSNEEILKSGELIQTDPETGITGLSLAALLLFGKDSAIRRFASWYRIDILCRIHDTMLYDDRLIIESNLIQAYDLIMQFIVKHMPEIPFLDGTLRLPLRDVIMREVVLNMLIHREYSGGHHATLTIYQDTVVAENWNIPFVYGNIDMTNTKPHRKNPAIAKVFSNMGFVEELGSGLRKIFKYTPHFSDGKPPIVTEGDIYRIVIPYRSTIAEVKSAEKSAEKRNVKEKSKDKVIRLLKENPEMTTADLASVCGLTASRIEKIISQLKKEGVLERVGPDKGGHWKIKN